MNLNKVAENITQKIQSAPQKWADLSIIIPVYNNPGDLIECITALRASSDKHNIEIIVVDDGSTDNTFCTAKRLNVRVLTLEKNGGQSVARNYGAQYAQSDLLFFVDADVVIAPNVIDKVLDFFSHHTDITALFGSYDTNPRAQGTVSQYKNLSHHFIHQMGNEEASTFWSGCGAIRRNVFLEIGGFNEGIHNYGHMEDIELGYRIRQAGYRIRLDPTLQGTHLKKWTLASMIRTDVFYRAIPWSRLIIENREFPNDLNLKWKQRFSVILSLVTVLCLLASFLQPALLTVSAASMGGMIALNHALFGLFLRKRGLRFALVCVPLHLLYYLYSGLSFIYVLFHYRIQRPGA